MCVIDQIKSRSEVMKFTEKMRNELNRMKNQFTIFEVLCFFSYGRCYTEKASTNLPIYPYLKNQRSQISENWFFIILKIFRIFHVSMTYCDIFQFFCRKTFDPFDYKQKKKFLPKVMMKTRPKITEIATLPKSA